MLARAIAAAAVGSAFTQAPAVRANPWPRANQLSNATVMVIQPQVEAWDGNRSQIRAAVSIKPAGTPARIFSAVFATVRTEVDSVARTVVFADLAITMSNFPTLSNQGAACASE